MIVAPSLLGFLAAAAILTITPGVDTALVLRAAAIEGRRAAAGAALGVALGCLAWGAAVALGLGALLRASPLAYALLTYAGAGYLVWLGARLWLKPRETALGAPAKSGGLARGLLTNLLNPKVGVFYVTFLPQFAPPAGNVAAYSFFLACLHVALGLAWFAVLIAATASLARWLRRPNVVRALDRATGAVFVAFGVKLATSSALS